MGLKAFLRSIKGLFHKVSEWSEESEEKVYITQEPEEEQSIDEIHSVWDHLKFKPNTQAFHLASVLGFDEWVDMNEIRRRIKELFSAEYKNERSLYPYLKTLTDVGLMENSSVGGRMQWRKYDLALKIEKKDAEKRIVIESKQSKEKKEKSTDKN